MGHIDTGKVNLDSKELLMQRPFGGVDPMRPVWLERNEQGEWLEKGCKGQHTLPGL